jgi:hypothetical protein
VSREKKNSLLTTLKTRKMFKLCAAQIFFSFYYLSVTGLSAISKLSIVHAFPVSLLASVDEMISLIGKNFFAKKQEAKQDEECFHGETFD